MAKSEHSGAAVGFTAFAAIVLIIVGVCQALAGFAAIVKDDSVIYAGTAEKSYFLHLDTTGWGWTHLIVGVVLFLAGLGIIGAQVWARTVGVIAAGIAIIVNFAFIPIYPVWSIVLIALAVSVIWALTAHGRDILDN